MSDEKHLENSDSDSEMSDSEVESSERQNTLKKKTLSYNEVFNSDKLAYLVKNKSQFLPQMTITDEYDPFFLPERYLKKSRDGRIDVRYSQTGDTASGRFFADGSLSLQSFSREIRHTIAGE